MSASQNAKYNKISHRNLKNLVLLLVHQKANMITCQITARCVRHLSHGRPSYRPPQPSSGRCTRTARNPLPRGCTKNTQFIFFHSDHSHKHGLKCIFSFCLPDFSIRAQVLNGHLTRFGSVQSNFRVRQRL